MDLDDLYEQLEKVRALADGAATDGERAAAQKAEEKLQNRIDQESGADEPDVEYRFSIHDPWQRRLFIAICRRHDLEPFQYKRQKRQSVMLRAPERFVDEVLWPEYEEMSDILTDYLDDVTTGVIEDVLGQEDTDTDVISGSLPS